MSSSPSRSAALTASPAASSPCGSKICVNLLCREQIVADASPPRRRGWRLRSGEVAELCARCGYAFDQGSFCETFHSDNDGWRKCESCGKRVHCGCIASVSTFILLDVGGIECITCARKNLITAPNHVSQSSLIFTLGSERLKDSSTKNWSQLNSSNTVPGQWRQASNMWKTFSQSDLQQRLSYEFDRPNGIDRMMTSQRLPIPPHNKKKAEDSQMNRVQIDGHMNMNGSYGSPTVFSELHRDERCIVGLEETTMVNSYGGSSGISFGPLSNTIPSIVKDETPVHLVGLVSSPPGDPNNSASRIRQLNSPQVAKQVFHGAAESSGEAQAKNARSRMEGRCRNQLLPRYWPRITDQELQQISGDPNSVVTPLFEKMLSASDAGRIGRLVLPKKCAEAYFPPISQPEGLPLKVQDANGQEWVFQFRFWPNNNSRMYVLEGVTPCIQSMKLQAGDTVTFSRMDPDGKLVMGFRKASNVSNDQEIQASKGGNPYSLTKEVNHRNGSKSGEEISAIHSRSSKTALLKADKSGNIENVKITSKIVALPPKRKGAAPGSRKKRLRMENKDSIELKLTWEEAQELLHPPLNHKPSIVIIEGHEFEEYEVAPVLGKPAAFAMNEAEYPSPTAPEATSLQSPDLGPTSNVRKNKGKSEMEAAEGLDALANLAILGEDPPSSSSPSSLHHIYLPDPHHHLHHHDHHHHHHHQYDPHQAEQEQQTAPPTTRHPRHRPGCSCIVCIQPPSGKGPKHKPSCQCNVCLTVKRRFRTLMLRKEKRQSEKDCNGLGEKAVGVPLAPPLVEEEIRKVVPSPIKTPQIDLNIQPDREEEPSPVSDAGNLMRLLQDAAA